MSDNNALLQSEGVPISNGDTSKDISDQDPFGLKNIGKVFEAFESHYIATYLIFIFTGYVIMASTGHLNDNEFIQYLIFIFYLVAAVVIWQIILYLRDIIRIVFGLISKIGYGAKLKLVLLNGLITSKFK